MRRTPRPLTALAVAARVAVAGVGCGRTENGSGMNTIARAGESAAPAAKQSEDAVPRSGDLCGGTGGYGRIVRIGSDALTVQRNADGTSQIIHVTRGSTIRTPVGVVSVSDLQIGNRVTVVGDPNPDGSFTAN